MKKREDALLSLPSDQQSMRRDRDIAYLACPYSHSNPDIRLLRFERATRAAAHLIETGIVVFSPVTMTHPIDLVIAGDNKTMGSDYWTTFDEAFMDFCSEMLILTLDGWTDSLGIHREILYFTAKQKPIYLLDQHTFARTIFRRSN